MSFSPLLLIYFTPLVLVWAAWIVHARRKSASARTIMLESEAAGLNEPPSLHPVFDPARCLGCASCARACPEMTVIGIIDGKATLIEPTLCIGHGACAEACPTGAISLVFGTATRGVDIPVVSAEFESSVPGIFIAGELGGMGLIKNAIEQGRQAIGHAASHAKRVTGGDDILDVLIVGCGPAGIAAGLGAQERKLDFKVIDQSTLGGTVAHYPRGKVVMTAPATLPLVGEVRFGEVNKDHLLAFWEGVLERTGLQPLFEEQVINIRREAAGFLIATNKSSYTAKAVVLAIGRRGTPRPLGVIGEELSKVVYRLTEPEQYAGKRVLVVGGGDSALEAAAQLATESDAEVTLSYRGEAYGRARQANRKKVAKLVSIGRITELLGTEVRRIEHDIVEIAHKDRVHTLANDAVIICAGGILPTDFLRQAGITVETRFGTAR